MSLRKTVAESLSSSLELSRKIEKVFGKANRVTKIKKRIQPTIDILNRSLCDDAIRYLAPTLKAYKGCTLIDIHPGTCEWSASLHDYLKPKRHVLMEPEEKYFKPFIKPLLDKPGSTYRHTPLSGAHPRMYWSNYKKIFEDGELMEARLPLPLDDPRLREVDTSILITGNLARRYTDFNRFPKQVTLTQLALQQFTWGSLTNSLFHQAGLARILLWIPDAFKEHALTPLITGRSSYNMTLSIGAQINEVVGVKENYDTFISRLNRSYNRPTGVLAASSLDVSQRMKEDATRAPTRRRLLQSTRLESQQNDGKNFLAVPDESLEEFQKACDAFDARLASIIDTYSRTGQRAYSVDKVMNEYLPTIEYPQCREMRLPPNPSIRSWKHILMLDLTFRLVNLEARFCALQEKGINMGSLKERLITTNERLRERIYVEREEALDWSDTHLDDQQAYFATPQIIPWDRRRLEPLQAKAEDFWLHYPLALLDITPSTRTDLAVPGIAPTEEVVATCQRLIQYLYHTRLQPLGSVLDSIAPNAARDLIPMIDGISDPRRGGRLDPTKVRVRMLSEDMMVSLAKAWFEWPFRPTRWQLERITSSFTAKDMDDENPLISLAPQHVSDAEEE